MLSPSQIDVLRELQAVAESIGRLRVPTRMVLDWKRRQRAKLARWERN